MRRPDELALYAALREAASDHEAGPGSGRAPGFEVPALAMALGIPEKRAWGLLSKWSDKGWWEYGVSLRTGWFTSAAPQELTP